MDVTTLITVPYALPAPPLIMKLFLVGGFGLHILLVNLILGTLCMALFMKEGQGRDYIAAAGKRLPILMAFAVNLGVVPLLFLQGAYGQFSYTAAALMGGRLMLLPGIVFLVYAGLYINKSGPAQIRNNVLLAAGLVALMVVVSFLFSNVSTLMLDPERWLAWFQEKGAVLNSGDPTLVPRLLHFLIASVAFSGLAMALFGKTNGNAKWLQTGCAVFFWATILQMADGVWFFFSLPGDVQQVLLGKGVVVTAVFGLAVAAAGASLFFAAKRMPVGAACSIAPTFMGMLVLRDVVRDGYLKSYFALGGAAQRMEPQAVLFFVAALAVGIALTGFIILVLRRSGAGPITTEGEA